MTFVFDRNYDNLEQVAEYLPAFNALYAEGLRYNDDFRGRIPAIANTEPRGPNQGTHEDTAIYLLQGLRRQRQQDDRVAALLAEGFEPVDQLAGVERFSRIVLYPTRRMGGEMAEYTDARLVPVENGRPAYVLPKGKRTRGHLVSGRAVLVLR